MTKEKQQFKQQQQHFHKMATTVLVTGGAGYVGSHSVLLMLNQDYRVVVVDNCSNAHINEYDSIGGLPALPESLKRVEELTGRKLTAYYLLDLVNDTRLLDDIFRLHNIKAVIHFAALKSVSESIGLPLEYYTNNIIGTINLLNIMKLHGCRKLIFSSSATVYGLPQYLPVDERHQVGQNILNPYGTSKFMIEQILKDLCSASSRQPKENASSNGGWKIIALRYFNPVGAHPSGYIGEHTQGVPNNLMPYISQVAVGKREKLFIFGDDFDTIDGTGVRDYIHIMDLASGHTYALDYLFRPDLDKQENFYKVYNLGTGRGHSVLEVIRTFQDVNQVQIPYEIIGRREGDAGEVYADASLAYKELGWAAKYSLVEMCRDTYRWQSTHPDGFKTKIMKPANLVSTPNGKSELIDAKQQKKVASLITT